jgi:hypothetical protein
MKFVKVTWASGAYNKEKKYFSISRKKWFTRNITLMEISI